MSLHAVLRMTHTRTFYPFCFISHPEKHPLFLHPLYIFFLTTKTFTVILQSHCITDVSGVNWNDSSGGGSSPPVFTASLHTWINEVVQHTERRQYLILSARAAHTSPVLWYEVPNKLLFTKTVEGIVCCRYHIGRECSVKCQVAWLSAASKYLIPYPGDVKRE